MKKFNKFKGKAMGSCENDGVNKIHFAFIDGTTHASTLRTETIPWDQELMQLGFKSMLSCHSI